MTIKPWWFRLNRILLLASFLCTALPGSVFASEISSEILLLPAMNGVFRFDVPRNATLDREEFVPSIDVFASLNYRSFRLLAEFFMDTEERELERFEAAWVTDDFTVSLGRVHNPLGYWNTQYHHGVFFQTSATRPGIVAYEDEGGPIPMHVTGILFYGQSNIGAEAMGLNYSITAGLAPEFSAQLQPWNLLNPKKHAGGHGVTAKISLLPDITGNTEFGAFAGYYRIPVREVGIDEIHQVIAGLYGNWQAENWRVIGALFSVYNHLRKPVGNSTDIFASAYLQPEYELFPGGTLYGRGEGTLAEGGEYLDLFPDFVRHRFLGGFRYQFLDRQAVTFEVGKAYTHDGSVGEVNLQWNAVFE